MGGFYISGSRVFLEHLGEVNRIRELPQDSKIVATHTDSPDVLIWDVEAQPNRHAVLGATDSRPDLILTGHQENAEFALAMCPQLNPLSYPEVWIIVLQCFLEGFLAL
ncbi:WD-40 repeat-containing protein MSI4-like [Hibiscus syriacus]|uniref:WD-40 repeat-containing protein MSI4-like n=1 Tax=Hibiscus syriacus TaxID=106335 RepID=UPI001922CE7A|nr:WD-40 repeat-containing protein MSI4-like [Hibiscus syriacus]